jgi:hypothetical protein
MLSRLAVSATLSSTVKDAESPAARLKGDQVICPPENALPVACLNVDQNQTSRKF